AAGRLRDEMALGVHESDGEVLIFVDIGAKGRARDIRIDLIGDRDDAVADHFERDRIELGSSLRDGVHQCLSYLRPQAIRISPMVPILKLPPGQTSVLEPYSSITAGPAASTPAGSA